MSYQVLARKWRPRTFREMVGQEHVLQALINALDHNRLHHAYLFTGTRGVGKTTIARILAKCLNCETGVSSEPCGQCSACVEIAENRFVDLIEVDAASRTKVEDTRELLENVQYAPTRGRYKVYLIDEVHMLSTHSFNALLKTLEEPPPHVKFLLATTDPQRLPVTVLSRCLQFNLKNMNPERIVQHLQFVLEKELVPFEESALWLLGRSADGSMRDAMSLTDQAIAFGSGKITEAEVRAMLGTIDQGAIGALITALANLDGKALLEAVEQVSEQAPDYAGVLAELLTLLHRIAIAQALPEAVDNSHGDRDRVLELAQQLAPEDVQLFYQTALLGRRDLPLAPDPRAGLEMVLLRMLAFKPQGVVEVPTKPLPSGGTPKAQPQSPGSQLADRIAEPESPPAPPMESQAEPQTSAPAAKPQETTPPEVASEPARNLADDAESKPAQTVSDAPQYESQDAQDAPFDGPYDRPAVDAQRTVERPQTVTENQTNSPIQMGEGEPAKKPEAPAAPVPAKPRAPRLSLEQAAPDTWVQIYAGLELGGLLQATVANCVLVGRQGNALDFILDEAHSALFDEGHQQRLGDQLSDYFGEPVRVRIQPGSVPGETPAAMAIRLRQENLAGAVSAIKNDPLVQQLMDQFDATLREDTVEPLTK
ncbi:DNA polymerase III subunit gamma/tau [Marinimicrobium sp. ABcell2]|uniref:DNA polymerase III subunit gamma/tau n=1 Tax=Marinimicrobium sp. ABcell2 TaxID=3069751 RepID=UPI0027B35FA4|nr:DNA polymerase III subunit gamma/tau [Marinimicrobium sp. ABcell2]MDQ2077952.1 DNA polymerase III subunit gamma/tau [Marinimicrobium sp. ABcell2]